MENSQIINEIKNNIECSICSENFVKITYEQLCIFLEKNKEILPESFENDNSCRCYEDRFECLTCKNVICRECYWNFKDHMFKPSDDSIGFYEASGNLDEDGLVEGCPGQDCPIICPFCRTKDYKIFYGNQTPYELLNEIKNRRLN